VASIEKIALGVLPQAPYDPHDRSAETATSGVSEISCAGG
jgi:hypothetical protein